MPIFPEWISEGWIVALVAVFGLAFGSFVTLVSYRLPRGEPIVAGRSRCPSCDTRLTARALVPLFSWLWQRGRCRSCAAKISGRYPLTEGVQAALFVAVYLSHGLTGASILLMLLCVALMVMVVVDFEWYIIPDEVQIACLVLALGYHWLAGTSMFEVLASGAVGAFIGFSLHYGYRWLMRKDGLGMGDVKFLMVAGLWLADVNDWPAFLFFAGVAGVATALVWRVLGRGSRFPFGPALAASLLLILLTPLGQLFFWTIGRLYA